MSATTHHHHRTIEANMRTDYNPRQIENLETHIANIIKIIEEKTNRLIETHRRRARLQPVNPPAWMIRRELEELHVQLDLAISEYEHRNI